MVKSPIVNTQWSMVNSPMVNYNEIPTLFEQGTLLHDGRNQLRTLMVEGLAICVKRYARPRGLNRWIYRFIRPSKGFRAYRNAQLLIEAGFDTPQPIAYIEQHRWGGIAYSYFVSTMVTTGTCAYALGDMPAEKAKTIVTQLAQFAARLHDKGILHLDFTPGNIIYQQQDGGLHFTLVDINRMRFGKVGIREGLKNMKGLWLQDDMAELLAHEYLSARGIERENQAELAEYYQQCRLRFWRRFIRRHHSPYPMCHRYQDGHADTYHYSQQYL